MEGHLKLKKTTRNAIILREWRVELKFYRGMNWQELVEQKLMHRTQGISILHKQASIIHKVNENILIKLRNKVGGVGKVIEERDTSSSVYLLWESFQISVFSFYVIIKQTCRDSITTNVGLAVANNLVPKIIWSLELVRKVLGKWWSHNKRNHNIKHTQNFR